MTSRAIDWRNDWSTFVRRVGEKYNDGFSDAEVTAFFCDVPVRWTGRISELCLDDKKSPGARIHMPPTRIDLVDGSYAVVDFLYLNIAPDNVPSWQSIHAGSEVRFETLIKKGYSLFPGIHWSVGKRHPPFRPVARWVRFLFRDFGVVMIGTRDSRFVDNIA